MNKYDKKHLKNLSAIQKQIDKIYREAAKEAASLTDLIRDFNPNAVFSFEDYPITRKRVEKLLSELKNGISAVVLNGVKSEWTLANNKNNELANMVFGNNVGKLSEAQYRRYYSTNEEARVSFTKRRENGLNLSDRVWRYTNQFKEEIELGIDCGLRDGHGADEMARDLKQYLQNPDELFRRVRDAHGVLQLSKRAAAYHPGQGVYRSSFKNARRLAVTEGNIAFHTADYTRWQQLDFVVGIEIKLSNNHTLNGKPFTDICDVLAGKYPKEFKFTGWHPLCRCSVITILKTEKEIEADTDLIMKGKPLTGKSVNRIYDVPTQFKKWVTDNKGKIAASRYTGKTPYFLTDNDRFINLSDFKVTKRQKMIIDAKKEYLSHNSTQWKRISFNKDNGGYLVADNERIQKAMANKQESSKFFKEREMSICYANNGYKIEMLREIAGVSSADVNINGIPAELKRSSSHNNILSYAKKATRQQGAKIVLFQFDKMTINIHQELAKMKKLGIDYKYFITGENKIYEI